jgi:hypothetical protein
VSSRTTWDTQWDSLKKPKERTKCGGTHLESPLTWETEIGGSGSEVSLRDPISKSRMSVFMSDNPSFSGGGRRRISTWTWPQQKWETLSWKTN